MANEVKDDVLDTLKDRYLTFPMSDKTLAFEVEFVNEIIDVQDITFVPMVPSYIEGVINLRGKVIPIINFYKLFNIDKAKHKRIRCMAIIEYKDTCIGVMVERVNEVLEITPDKIVGAVANENAEATNTDAEVLDGAEVKSSENTDNDNLSGEDKAIAEFVKATAELDEYNCLIIDIDKLIAIRK